MATGQGTAIIDFGAFPGKNETSVAYADVAIGAGSKVEAYIMGDDETLTTYPTDGHTAADHRYFEAFVNLSCGTPTAGVGDTIYARSIHNMQGKWKVRVVWAD